MPLPEPPALDGVTWRPATVADAGIVADLQNAVFAADGGYRMTAEEFANILSDPDNDMAEDSLIAIDGTGRAVALVFINLPSPTNTKARVFLWQYVHPERRGMGLEDFLLDWFEARGRRRFAALEGDVPGLFRSGAYDWQQDKIRRLEARGYQPIRYFSELLQALDGEIEQAPVPDGYAIEPWPDDSDPIRLLHNEAFQDHWGSEPRTEDMWRRYTLDEFFRQDLSLIATRNGQPAAYLHTAVYPHDFEDRGRTEAWVEILGTGRAHRKKGLASALITRALAAYRDDGFEYAAIGVDSDSLTGALRLYESLGFQNEKRSIAFGKPIE